MNTILTRRRMLAIGTAAMLTPYQTLRAAPSPGELADDIDIVRETLTLHPGLYRYQTPREADERVGKLKRDYAAATTLEQRFLFLSAFTATIRCGHTQCNPYNQKKAVVQRLFERPTRLPFEFDWISGQMIVLADRSGLGLPPGTVIRSINGEAPARLLKKLIGYARADGSNDAKRVAQMAMLNIDRFETFDIFQSLLHPPEGGMFHIGYRLPSGREAEASVASLTPEQRRATRHTLETDGTSATFLDMGDAGQDRRTDDAELGDVQQQMGLGAVAEGATGFTAGRFRLSN